MENNERPLEKLALLYESDRQYLSGMLDEIISRLPEFPASRVCMFMTRHFGRDDHDGHRRVRTAARREALRRLQEEDSGLSVFYICGLTSGDAVFLRTAQQTILTRLDSLPASEVMQTLFAAERYGHRTLARDAARHLALRGYGMPGQGGLLDY